MNALSGRLSAWLWIHCPVGCQREYECIVIVDGHPECDVNRSVITGFNNLMDNGHPELCWFCHRSVIPVVNSMDNGHHELCWLCHRSVIPGSCKIPKGLVSVGHSAVKLCFNTRICHIAGHMAACKWSGISGPPSDPCYSAENGRKTIVMMMMMNRTCLIE